jgi:hypothetical protein
MGIVKRRLKMQHNGIIDYAMPCMNAERELKELHEQMLRNNYEFALQHAKNAMAECKLIQTAIKHMMEQGKGGAFVKELE